MELLDKFNKNSYILNYLDNKLETYKYDVCDKAASDDKYYDLLYMDSINYLNSYINKNIIKCEKIKFKNKLKIKLNKFILEINFDVYNSVFGICLVINDTVLETHKQEELDVYSLIHKIKFLKSLSAK